MQTVLINSETRKTTAQAKEKKRDRKKIRNRKIFIPVNRGGEIHHWREVCSLRETFTRKIVDLPKIRTPVDEENIKRFLNTLHRFLKRVLGKDGAKRQLFNGEVERFLYYTQTPDYRELVRQPGVNFRYGILSEGGKFRFYLRRPKRAVRKTETSVAQ